MSEKDGFKLSRRKALGALGTIGVASAGAGMGTTAWLNDPETVKGNTITAGELDLKLDWHWVYGGKSVQKFTQGLADDDEFNGPMVKLGDVKPGDWGLGIFSLHVYDNPAWLWFRTSQFDSGEGDSAKEPEKESSDEDYSQDGSGELAKKIKTFWFPAGRYKSEDANADAPASTVQAQSAEELSGEMPDATSMANASNWTTDDSSGNQMPAESSPYHCWKPGNLQEVHSYFKDGFKFPHKIWNSCTYYFAFFWYIPKSVGNEIQGDTVEFNLDFYAQQARHNDGNTNPWNNDD